MRLHGVWVIEDEVMQRGKLFLWAEPLKPELPTRPRKTNIHPYALSSKEILKCLKVPATSHQQTLLLPSHERSPIPSSSMDISIGERPDLREWKTPGVVVEDGEILGFLALLDEARLREERILLGKDLIFLSRVARFGLELLVRQRFLPWLKSSEEMPNKRRLICYWQPVFISEEEKKLFSHLKNEMPDSARCASLNKRVPTRERHILHLLSFLMNLTIRDSIGYDIRGFFIGEDRLDQGRDGFLDLPKRDLLYSQFKEWSSRLAIEAKSGGFRTCFRLEAPEDNDNPWHLRFLLQAEDDPSLLIEAEDAYKETKSKDAGLRDFHTRFLADLGVATRLFPTIEKALAAPRPHSLQLNTDEAYSFLVESSLLLKECGFGIFVPSFWDMERRRGTHPGVAIKAVPSDSESGFGLSQIIRFDWRIAVGDETISKEEFERLVELKIPLVNIRGQWVELQPDIQEGLLKYLKTKREMPLSELIRLSLTGGDGEGLLLSKIETEGWLKELLESLKGDLKFKELAQPEEFIGKLRPYQIRGLSWMAYMNRFGLGVCLADDMGLGKTIQFIALLLHQKRQGLKGPSLLICPTSVMGNWERELNRFSPDLKVMLHHGPARLVGREFKREAEEQDIVITSYSLMYRDREALQDIRFRYMVLDEAQNIKNPYTRQAQTARAISADLRLALTGTPIENRLSELWSIMEFLNPGYLKSMAEFRRCLAIPIERYNDEESKKRLKGMILPFILRRLKTDPEIITDLPDKVETKTFCPLTKEQATLYQATVEDMMEKIESSDGIERKGEVLALLIKLKQICNHPALFLHDRSKLEGRSGKLERLSQMLEEVLEENDNALIFTQFAEMGKMLKDYLEDQFLCEVPFLYGGVSRKRREEMIKRFQSEDGPNLFVLSLKAGGLGLNLTRANRVFHFDRWWNPAVENQATDRVFRIGQKKNVMVHKFLCQGTIEERIDGMLEKKKELAEGIIGAGEDWITELSTEQLRKLFALDKEAVIE